LDVSVMARMYVSVLTTGTGSVDSTPVITFEGERGHMKCIYLETELTFGLWPSFTLSRNSRQWCQGLDVEGRQLLGIAVVILQLWRTWWWAMITALQQSVIEYVNEDGAWLQHGGGTIWSCIKCAWLWCASESFCKNFPSKLIYICFTKLHNCHCLCKWL